MSAVPADLSISARWMLPMTSRAEVLEHHTLIVRDGRIVDLLPTSAARQRYAASVAVDRSAHLLLPGLVDAGASSMPAGERAARRDRQHDHQQLSIAAMLKSGITCYFSSGYFPEESARCAAEQGMRTVVGIPIAEAPSPWASNAAEYLTRALRFRDEHRGHPTVATAFAPLASAALSDETFRRMSTLADELDAGVLMGLHETRAEIEESLARHGLRPIERVNALGLLTPALTAVHMVHVDHTDIALAERGGIAVTLCPESSLRTGSGFPPAASWVATGLRLGMGSGAAPPNGSLNLWPSMRLLALLPGTPPLATSARPGTATHPTTAACAAAAPHAANADLFAWDALFMATHGGAAALGLDAEIGTLESGKWADLCCIDLEHPALFRAAAPHSPQTLASRLVLGGAGDAVSDVWVSGRQLLHGGAFTRLEWPALVARMGAWT